MQIAIKLLRPVLIIAMLLTAINGNTAKLSLKDLQVQVNDLQTQVDECEFVLDQSKVYINALNNENATLKRIVETSAKLNESQADKLASYQSESDNLPWFMLVAFVSGVTIGAFSRSLP
jgi:hypothetical protein